MKRKGVKDMDILADVGVEVKDAAGVVVVVVANVVRHAKLVITAVMLDISLPTAGHPVAVQKMKATTRMMRPTTATTSLALTLVYFGVHLAERNQGVESV